jgi:hypothetical protein
VREDPLHRVVTEIADTIKEEEMGPGWFSRHDHWRS